MFSFPWLIVLLNYEERNCLFSVKKMSAFVQNVLQWVKNYKYSTKSCWAVCYISPEINLKERLNNHCKFFLLLRTKILARLYIKMAPFLIEVTVFFCHTIYIKVSPLRDASRKWQNNHSSVTTINNIQITKFFLLRKYPNHCQGAVRVHVLLFNVFEISNKNFFLCANTLQ